MSLSSCIIGGDEVVYQERKRRIMTYALYLTDSQWLELSISIPFSGNKNELVNIKQTFEVLITMLEDTTISVDELFLNADGGLIVVAIRRRKVHQLCHQIQMGINIASDERNATYDN